MKRLLAYPLLMLLLYNTFGYYALVVNQTYEHAVNLKTQTDAADLQEVKIPISLYTHTEDSDFKTVEKEITLEGNVYWVVKQRIQNDTLRIYCLHDYKKENLNNQLADAAQVNQKSVPVAPVKWLIKSFLKEFELPQNEKFSFQNDTLFENSTQPISAFFQCRFAQCHLAPYAPPPNA